MWMRELLKTAIHARSRVANPPVFPWDIPYFGLIVPFPGLGLPGTPNVPFFSRGQMLLK